MSELPDRMDIEVEEADIITDGNILLDAMGSIRLYSINSPKKSELHPEKEFLTDRETEEEYLHLTYRLASIIEGFDNSKRHIDTITNALAKNSSLLGYDYLQNQIWTDKNPKINDSLDKLTIMLRRENTCIMKDKHHIMQAVKYLYAQEQDLTEKKKTLDNILPKFTDFNLKDNEFFKKEMKRLKLKAIAQENGVLFSKKDKKLEELVDIATSLGFNELQYVTQHKKYEAREEFLDSHIVDFMRVKNSKHNPWAMYGERHQRLQRLAPKFKLLTYPILGNLPNSYQKSIEEYLGHGGFNRTKASAVSTLFNMAPYAYACYEMGHLAARIQNTHLAFAVGATTFLMICGSLFETIKRGMDIDIYSKGHGTALGKIASLPFDTYKSIKEGKRNRQENKVVVSIDLTNQEKEKLDDYNYFSELSNLATKKLTENLEKNLTWSEQNHHTFGAKFNNELRKEDNIENCEKIIDKENETYTYFNIREFDGYNNLAALICKKDERYLLSMIGKTEPQMEYINNIINNKDPTKKKLKQLAKQATFTRIQKYEKNILKDDYEVLK